MKKTSWIATAALAAALLAGPGLAQTTQPPPSAPPGKSAPVAKAAARTEAGSLHRMQGEVTKVNAKKGWIDVKTPEGRLKLHYPPPALDSVKAGDLVTVEIALHK